MIVFKEISNYKKLQKSKTKEQFTNILVNSTAHNISTPINSIKGFTELLELDQSVMHSLSSKEHIRLIKLCLKILIFNTKNLMEHSVIRLKQFKRNQNTINLSTAFKDILEIFKIQSEQKGLLFLKFFDTTVKDRLVRIDQSRLELVLFNLLQNAIQYTFKGSIKIKMKILNKDVLITKFDNIFYSSSSYIRTDFQDKKEQGIQNEEDLKQLNANIIRTEVLDSFSTDQQFLSISITDSGKGMSINEINQVFSLFSLGKISQDQINQQGMGLGLTVSQMICEQYGGKIFIEKTEIEQGTKISLIIPIELVEADDIHALITSRTQFFDSKTQETSNFDHPSVTDRLGQRFKREYIGNYEPMKTLVFDQLPNPSRSASLILHQNQIECRRQNNQKILIVDDTPFNVQVLEMILKQIFDIKCDVAYSGNEAIEIVMKRLNVDAQDQYQLIIMDINMPGLDGVETTRKIKDILKNNQISKIYAHTAINLEQFGSYAEKGFDGFIAKPIEVNYLSQVLSQIKLI
ncbi:multi-sensor hybrid histidine kinase [Stylonychia lemnae]|uniref:Multi-sensor hybrid histidine kinase n=1 Tax=Stylonychia lemnae TaxID=5949 RepID=A0A078ASQ8_STYLE|nr:multi-sensor hybrid histidine kinase [Stylonychia lemnae]|eukprot:CDW85046.1 multi-sensor hybrid histidine kinase [Stylonychia lemnae]